MLPAKVPQETANGDFFAKARFEIDLAARTVTCPAGHTTRKYTPDRAGGRLFHFGAACAECPLREQCTAAKGGRQVRVHPQEALLRTARAVQQPPAGRQVLRERGVIEHRLARLGQLGVGQARYCGGKKTRFQVLLAATIANLRRTWNWSATQTAPEPPPPVMAFCQAIRERLQGRSTGHEWRSVVRKHWLEVAAGAT